MGFDGFQNPPVGAQGTITRAVFKSDNWVSGTSGWAIFKNGNAEFNALGGSFQITTLGIFFYVPSAGIGKLRMSLTNADGIDPYGNNYHAGLFLNQRQAWFTGTGSDTITINPTGSGGPELLFTESGFPAFARIIGIANTLFFDEVGGSAALFQFTRPVTISNDLTVTNELTLQGIDIAGVWTPYVPQWLASTTNPTIGNGTLSGAYMQIGKTVHFWAYLKLGSTSNPGSGLYWLTLPVFPKLSNAFSCSGWVNDASASARFTCSLSQSPGGTQRIFVNGGSGVSNVIPFTFTTNDEITISGTYETI